MSPKTLIKIDPPKGLRSDLIKLGHDPDNPQRFLKTENPEAIAILGEKQAQTTPQKSSRCKGKWFFGIGAFLGPLGLLAGKSWGMDFPEPPEIIESAEPPTPTLLEPEIMTSLPIWFADHGVLLATTVIVGIGTAIGLAILHRLVRIENALKPELEGHEAQDIPFESDDCFAWATTGSASRKGLVRDENQDAFCTLNIPGHDISIIAVFDGMGGRPKGKEAAECAASFIEDWLIAADSEVWQFPDQALNEALEACQAAFKNKQLIGASTALLVAITPDRIHYAALGDGCIALIHADGMVQQLLAPHHKPGAPKNLITAFLYADKTFTSRVGSVSCEPGSIVMAVSDGASDLVNFERLGAQRESILTDIENGSANNFVEKFLLDIERLTAPDSDRPLHTDNMTLALGIVRR